MNREAMGRVLAEVADERGRQHAVYGEQEMPDGTGGINAITICDAIRFEADSAARIGRLTWMHILDEEVREAFAETDPTRLREELVQVAAVACQWIEALDRGAEREKAERMAARAARKRARETAAKEQE